MAFQLVYASSAVEPFSESQLLELLEVSRRNNAKVGVTGMLLYRGGNFIQVLEGDRAAVLAVFSRVSMDSRHRGVLRFLSSEVVERDFAGWSMGFRNVKDEALKTTPGFSAFLNVDQPEALDGSKAMKLLKTFRQNFR